MREILLPPRAEIDMPSPEPPDERLRTPIIMRPQLAGLARVCFCLSHVFDVWSAQRYENTNCHQQTAPQRPSRCHQSPNPPSAPRLGESRPCHSFPVFQVHLSSTKGKKALLFASRRKFICNEPQISSTKGIQTPILSFRGQSQRGESAVK